MFCTGHAHAEKIEPLQNDLLALRRPIALLRHHVCSKGEFPICIWLHDCDQCSTLNCNTVNGKARKPIMASGRIESLAQEASWRSLAQLADILTCCVAKAFDMQSLCASRPARTPLPGLGLGLGSTSASLGSLAAALVATSAPESRFVGKIRHFIIIRESDTGFGEFHGLSFKKGKKCISNCFLFCWISMNDADL